MKKLLIAIILFGTSTLCFAHDVFVKVNSSGGFKDHPVFITDQHGVRLYNGRDTAMNYTYHYKLCINGGAKCKQVDVPIRLAPKSGTKEGQWTNRQSLQLEHIFRSPGHYQIQSWTWIDGDGEKSTNDVGQIVIY